MFTVYHSNDVHVLKTLVVELMARQPLSGAFDKETVLVQSPGMSQWLKLQLAEQFGIAANLDFPLPATFVWNIFKGVLDDVPERSAFSKEQMTWRLLEIIPDCLADSAFAPLQSYLKQDDRQVKLYQLSARIADIFDQYLMYRPHWVNAWEAGLLVEELNGEDQWQASLWRTLSQHTLDSGASRYHRANLYDECITRLNSGFCPDGIKRLKRIFIFGISALPPRYLQVLNALGQHIDVHFMLFNPCQFYWGDILDQKYVARMAARQRQDFYSGKIHAQLKGSLEDNLEGAVGNSLLASWGKVGRDMQRLLSEQTASEVEAFVEPEKSGLLPAIKRDMLFLKDAYTQNNQSTTQTPVKQVIDSNDASIRLSVCHSPMREVEILHDYLLDCFANDSSIQPRDVVVMVSDIDAYSPYIQAVFSSQPEERRIPFSISDLSSNHYHSIIQAFIWLLAAHQHRFTSSELLSFIQVPAVMQKFGFEEQDLDLISHWVQHAGIRWGLDEQTSVSFDLPEMKANTWLFGLERMLSGYAMSEQLGVIDGVLPYDQIQGLNAELAGKLAYLIQQLIQLWRQFVEIHDQRSIDQTTKLSAVQWKELLERIRQHFFSASDENDQRQLQQISTAISQWYGQLEEAGLISLNEEDGCYQGIMLTSEVMLEVMSEKLIQERISQRFLAGQLNFCTLMPMRSVPFKVVCLLGMDGNAYPRQQPPLGFDLMHGRFEYGDRSRRDDDRFLFLEAVLSAEQALYLSYTGRSIRDNSEIIPSILISELLDYCTEGFVLAGTEDQDEEGQAKAVLNHIIREYPMTAYSRSHFTDSERLSYASQWYDIASLSPTSSCLGADGEAEDIGFLNEVLPDYEFSGVLELSELTRFWSSPVRYFFHQRLKVYLLDVSDPIEEDERFELTPLQSYQLKQQLFDWSLTQGQSAAPSLDQLLEHYRAEGSLPYQAFGSLALEEHHGLVEQLVVYLSDLSSVDTQAAIEVNLALNVDQQSIQLEGWLTQFSGEGFLHYRVGQVRCQDAFNLWVSHLSACSQGISKSSSFVGVNARKQEIEHLGFMPVSQSQAMSLIELLISFWWRGMHQPLPVSVDIAQRYYDELQKPTSDETSLRASLKSEIEQWLTDDEYAGRCWSSVTETLLDDTIELIESVYIPMASRLVSFKDGSAKEEYKNLSVNGADNG